MTPNQSQEISPATPTSTLEQGPAPEPTPKDGSPRDPMAMRDLALQYLEAHSTGPRDGSRIPHLVFWKGVFHLWTDGEFKLYTPDEMTIITHRWLMDAGITSDYNVADKVTKCLKALRFLVVDDVQPFWLDPFEKLNATNREWIAMANEMISPPKYVSGSKYVVSRRALTPAWFTPCKLPYDFEEGATCPRWESWLADRVPDLALRKALQEFFGYCLLPTASRQTALFLVGDSGTGKSTVMRVLTAMLGESNCTNYPVEDLKKNFTIAGMYGKLLNWSDEVEKKITGGTEQKLKWYIAGTRMTADRKYLSALSFKPTARLAVCVNEWPQFKDATNGIWRRILCIPVKKVLAKEEQRDGVVDELLAELPGVFNWALEGYRRLTTQGHFTPSEEGSIELAAIQAEQQTVSSFVRSQVLPKETGFVRNPDLFLGYKRWCESQGLHAEGTIRVLLAEIRKQHPAVVPWHGRTQHPGSWTRGVRGVVLRQD